MVNFIPRKLVNGAILRTTTGEQVAIHVNVENGERYARTITGKTIDDLEVRLELDEPLNVEVNGWIQAIGIAKASNAIQAHEIILFPQENDQQPFDKKATNDMITFFNNCSDFYQTQ